MSQLAPNPKAPETLVQDLQQLITDASRHVASVVNSTLPGAVRLLRVGIGLDEVDVFSSLEFEIFTGLEVEPLADGGVHLKYKTSDRRMSVTALVFGEIG